MIIAPDISYFQVLLNLMFNRRVLIMRVTFSPDFVDPHFLANANVAAELYAKGQIDGVILYTVFLTGYTPAQQYAAVWKAIGPTVPVWLLGIMIDVESWNGTSYSIRGDHSKAFNQLYGMHAHKMGSWTAVPFYGNEGDLASIIPGRDKRAWGILARYSGAIDFKARRVPGVRGQQYTDGQSKWGVPRVNGRALPIASKPMGNADHNYLDFKDGKALRAFMRPGVTPAKPKPTKPVVNKPTKPPVVPAPYHGLPHGAGSPDGHWGLFMQNDGSVERRHNSKHVDYLVKGA